MRPIRLPSISTNQRLPWGLLVMAFGLRLGVGSRNSINVPLGVNTSREAMKMNASVALGHHVGRERGRRLVSRAVAVRRLIHWPLSWPTPHQSRRGGDEFEMLPSLCLFGRGPCASVRVHCAV